MTRSIWKGPFVDPIFLKRKLKLQNFKIWCRSSIIPAVLIGETILVHNGKDFKRVTITREKIGFKFGEFALTRRYTLKQKSSLVNKKQKK
jgi:small subunit ribosomal protein S19